MKRKISVLLLIAVLGTLLATVSAVAESNYISAWVIKETKVYNAKKQHVNTYEIGTKVKVVEKVSRNWCRMKNGLYIQEKHLSRNPIQYFVDKYHDIIFISISRQRLLYYIGDELIVDTPVVTGNLYTSPTPKGLYTAHHPREDTNLMDNPKYHVDKWISVTGNIGMHDASWRKGKFGKKIYKGHGSHGCINIPLDAMELIFSNFTKDRTKVLIFK